MVCMTALSQIVEPVKWSIAETLDGETLTLSLTAKVDNGFHLYGLDIPEGGPQKTELVFEVLEGATLDGSLEVAEGTLHESFDPNFEMKLSYYEKSLTLVQKLKVQEGYKVEGYVTYMSCNDQMCLPPTNWEFASGAGSATVPSVSPEGAATVPSASPEGATATIGTTESHPWWYILIAGFLAGLIALVTPCVWPMIPMTVSFFLKRTKDRKKSIRDAWTYGISIIVIYVGLGLLVTMIFGASALNSLATNAIFNIIFFLLLVVFALSFFGAFELTLPESWTTKLDAKADATTGLLSIFFMAFTLCLVSFSCTGPIIGTLLVEAATSGSMLYPAIGMFGFALALSLPFTMFAMFPSMLKSMPSSGGWLNMVKVVLGFCELALALKFLSVADLAYGWGILDREVFLSLWIVIFLLLGLYLLGMIRLPHDDDPDPSDRVSVTRLMMALISISFSVYMIPGLWGAPCKAISAFAPPMYTQDFNLDKDATIKTYHDYEQGLEAARLSGKTVLLDFSGFGCVNCRKMEAAVLTAPEVKSVLDNEFVFIELMVDDKTALPEVQVVEENGRQVKLRTIGDKWSYLQRTRFGANAQPYYVVLDANGNQRGGSYSYNEDIQEFLKFLGK